jgi:uncharacterized protein YijF (DUF1287 family)
MCPDRPVSALMSSSAPFGILWGADLQLLVHEDMARSFNAYPQTWGLPHPDSNIDHRRVPNLET